MLLRLGFVDLALVGGTAQSQLRAPLPSRGLQDVRRFLDGWRRARIRDAIVRLRADKAGEAKAALLPRYDDIFYEGLEWLDGLD